MPSRGIVCVGSRFGDIAAGTPVSFEACLAHSLGMPCDYGPEVIREFMPDPVTQRDPDLVSVSTLCTPCVKKMVAERRQEFLLNPAGAYAMWRGTVAHAAIQLGMAANDPVFSEIRVYKKTPRGLIVTGAPDWALPRNESRVGLLRDYKTKVEIKERWLPEEGHLRQLDGYRWLLDGGWVVGSEEGLNSFWQEMTVRGLTDFVSVPRPAGRYGLVWEEPVPTRMSAALLEKRALPFASQINMQFDRAGLVYMDMKRPLWSEYVPMRSLEAVERWVDEQSWVRYAALGTSPDVYPPDKHGEHYVCPFCPVQEWCKATGGSTGTSSPNMVKFGASEGSSSAPRPGKVKKIDLLGPVVVEDWGGLS